MRIGSRELPSVSLVIFLAASVLLAAQDSQTPAAQSVVERNVAVPMRDGVVLLADDYPRDSQAAEEIVGGLPFIDLELVEDAEFAILVEDFFRHRPE